MYFICCAISRGDEYDRVFAANCPLSFVTTTTIKLLDTNLTKTPVEYLNALYLGMWICAVVMLPPNGFVASLKSKPFTETV